MDSFRGRGSGSASTGQNKVLHTVSIWFIRLCCKPCASWVVYGSPVISLEGYGW